MMLRSLPGIMLFLRVPVLPLFISPKMTPVSSTSVDPYMIHYQLLIDIDWHYHEKQDIFMGHSYRYWYYFLQ